MQSDKPIAPEEIIYKDIVKGVPMEFHTAWGLFSPKQLDEGSRMLLDQVKVRLGDHNLDFGCGYGVIGLTLAKLSSQGKTHLVDKDFVAVEMAEKNAQINSVPNVEVYLSNVFSHVEKNNFDNIVSNIPGGIGKEVLLDFFTCSIDHLKVGGKIYVVCISGLKEFVKTHLLETFGNCDKLAQGKTYTVYSSTKVG